MQTYKVSAIKALSETLVEVGCCETQRIASSKIKKGLVRVGGYLVGNVDALLVITAPTVLECEGNVWNLVPLDQ